MCAKWSIYSFYDADYFYIDGSINAAENYCRAIDDSQPWCYSADGIRGVGFCHIRLCQEFGLTCDDGTDLTNYSGTVSVTDGSRTCQRWSEQTPHKHVFNTDDMFPLDGSVENAVNYCRNIGGDEHPWCLTIDPKVRSWQYCYEQICKVEPQCGGELTSISGSFASPDRDGDGNYDSHRDCLWIIHAPENKVIEVEFLWVDFSKYPVHTCEAAVAIEIYESLYSLTICNNTDNLLIRSYTNRLHVRFSSKCYNDGRGFRATYAQVENDTDATTTPTAEIITNVDSERNSKTKLEVLYISNLLSLIFLIV